MTNLYTKTETGWRLRAGFDEQLEPTPGWVQDMKEWLEGEGFTVAVGPHAPDSDKTPRSRYVSLVSDREDGDADLIAALNLPDSATPEELERVIQLIRNTLYFVCINVRIVERQDAPDVVMLDDLSNTKAEGRDERAT